MRLAFLITMAGAMSVTAADLNLSIEIPRMSVAEYHRPYVAAWLEKPDRTHAGDLFVWYETGRKNGEGEKWLKDIRQWWRKSGRSAKMPIDGVSGPTRPAGVQEVTVAEKVHKLASLPQGDYTLVVEASREVGGREMVRVPFKWDGKSAVEANAAGTSELGKIGLKIAP